MFDNWNWISAKWWKFDFHVHTPASLDYGKGSNQACLRQITPQNFLINFMKAEIDCIAVTDHNTGAWINCLKEAVEQLKQNKHPDFRPIFIFPGVEISVQGGIHLLAIFDENKTQSDIDGLLGAVGFNGTKGTSDDCTDLSISEVIDKISQRGGLAIPAHVDDINGLFQKTDGTTLKKVLSNKNIFSVELIKPSEPKPAQYISEPCTEVLGTDSHHPSGNPGESFPGSRFTWIKMSSPTFDGLRLALLDGDLSVRRSDNFTANPNLYGTMVIEEIEINDAKYLGRGGAFTCKLNPWLNSMIGGRGTGKSTVVEFLRTVLNRKSEIPLSLKSEFEKYYKASSSRDDDGLLTNTVSMKVIYRKNGEKFRITWKNDGDQYIIEKEDANNNWQPSVGDVAQRFPVRVYSQKQIFEVAKSPQALLKIIDEAPEVQYRVWYSKWEELTTKYMSIKSKEREIQISLKDEEALKGDLEDVNRRIDVFEKSGHSDILRDYQLGRNQNNAIFSWEQTWYNFGDRLKDVLDKFDIKGVEPAWFQEDKEENKELISEVDSIKVKLASIKDRVHLICTEVKQIEEEWKSKKDFLKLTNKINEFNQKYIELMTKLETEKIADPTQYSQLVSKKHEINSKLNTLNQNKIILQNLKVQAEKCLIEIKNHREIITANRKAFIDNVLKNNPHVKIEITPYGNKELVESTFRQLIDRGNGGFENVIGSTEDNEGLLADLYNSTGNLLHEKFDEFKNKIVRIYKDDKTVEIHKKFATYLQTLPPESIDRLNYFYPEDSVVTSYSINNGKDFKSVQQGSPGQKTAALLAFLLSYGSEPLILDQPEDDLHNSLIFDLIVTQLRMIKLNRQVIVVTHNANIVVNGDSENVLVLDIKKGQTRIIAQGSLQESKIRDHICHIMEGGKEAFSQRYKRINAHSFFTS